MGLRSLLPAIALACAAVLPIAQAGAPAGRIGTIISRIGTISHEGLTGNFGAGTFSMRKVVLRGDEGLLISADEVSVSGAESEFDNSQWELRGTVHVEYEGAVLDAGAAAVMFADGRMKTVDVQGNTGQPAQFAHTLKQTGRRAQGRAARIAYDAASRQVEFFNDIWFSNGRAEYEGDYISYNVDTTALSSGDNPGTRDTILLLPKGDDRVPPPREPERSTAQ
jgi:lipopolysaccharide transport protein LptA